ncbi:TPA: hypothetical protein ACSTL1_002747 [Serratia fonticola]|jgi:hypothetical protein|uniref:hypothetical protein n=1 Tax=Serratia fonticola TaxID=47917 RepID=UPI000FBFBB82|nr:hypothetical protein [Serratia fonticola]CAI2154560.1 Uncharacterised protein [Serratia fonticola]
MSIGLTCFTKLTFAELQHKLNEFAKRYPDVFPAHYFLSTAAIPHPIQKEVSNEFGLDPVSYCYISVNNKSLEISTDEMADMIRESFGANNVIVLLNGEDLI